MSDRFSLAAFSAHRSIASGTTDRFRDDRHAATGRRNRGVSLKFSAIGLAAAMAFAAPATAMQSQTDVASGAEEAEINASNRVICRRSAPPTGSRIGARNICKTEREWEQIDRDISRTMWNERMGNRIGNEGAGDGCMQMGRGC